jgi:GAF domain-containing protein
MCIPLILKEKIIGVFGALNIHSDRKFLSADRSLLKAIASQMYA